MRRLPQMTSRLAHSCDFGRASRSGAWAGGLLLATVFATPALALEAILSPVPGADDAGAQLLDLSYRLPAPASARPSLSGAVVAGAGIAAAEVPPNLDLPGKVRIQSHRLPSRLTAPASTDPAVYGPVDPGQATAEFADQSRYRSFGSQVGAIKWEVAAALAYYTAINGKKLFDDPQWPSFQKEGWFGRSTRNMGIDKLAHAYSGYIVSELFYGRLKHKTNQAPGIQFTAAALSFGIMAYTELWDSIEPDSGWSWEDVAFNGIGVGLSALRNSVPGLDRKLDFRLMIKPDSKGYRLQGKKHFEQQRYFFALKFSGFEAFEKTPLRLLELHLGYHAYDFTDEARAAGITPKRKIFVGAGINLRELLFRNSTTRVGRAAGEVLDYFQPPYTALHVDVKK